MKNIFITLLIIAATACSKEHIESNNEKKTIAITSYFYNHDTKWNLIDSGLSFHWHDVELAILEQFVGRDRDTLCNTIMTYRIHEDECTNKQP